jgi:integrase
MLAYHAGLRKGEIFGLEWMRVDFFDGNLIITKSYNGPTKNRRSRAVPMSAALQTALMDLANRSVSGSEKVIKPFDPGPVLRNNCVRAKLPAITMHAFRHTFATLALDSGVTIKEVQTMLGHTKASTTLDIYWNKIGETKEVDFT